MVTKKEIQNLANLARISMTEDEEDALTTEVDSILGFVDQIKKVDVSNAGTRTPIVVKNVFRTDDSEHDSEEYTKKLLEEAPDVEGGYIKVKKIL